MPTIYKYQRIITPGPNGTTLYFRNADESPATELCEFDGWRYVSVPDDVTMPDQWPEIGWQAVDVTPELKERIIKRSRVMQLIYQRMQAMIRAEHELEDELYFARIGVGVANGVYVFEPGEQEEMLAYGEFIEIVRQWGRAERAKYLP